MSDFIFDKNPFPKDPEKIIEKVINIIGTVVDWIGNIAGKTGETDSINDNSSLENIDRITSIFTDFREQAHTKAIEIENAVAKEVNYYVEELHDILDANADKVDKYNIHIKRIERQIDKIASKINGTIDNELCKKVSLDNTECKEIVKMDCQHFFRQIFLGYFSDIVQAFDTLRKNVCGDDYTSLHNPIVLSSVLPAYGMFHSIQILFL